ncbi:serine/arginine-rich splicing factor SR45a [Trifolium repens]|nr:serine/arginine-rich splicing factor SR45a [Trifolium repens]
MVSRSIDLSGQSLLMADFSPFSFWFCGLPFFCFWRALAVQLVFCFAVAAKRARTLTRGHYLGLKNTRDYGSHGDHRCDCGDFHGDHRGDHRGDFCGDHRGDRGGYRGGSGRGDYSYRRYRRERSRSIPQSPYSPDRRYAGGSR